MYVDRIRDTEVNLSHPNLFEGYNLYAHDGQGKFVHAEVRISMHE